MKKVSKPKKHKKENTSINTILLRLKRWISENYQESLSQIVLYGSQARGDATEKSDIDILIVLKDLSDYRAEIRKTSQFIADLSLEYNTVISRAFITEERFVHENSPFLLNVRREGIIL